MSKAADLAQFNVRKRAELTSVPRKKGDESTRERKTEARLITKGFRVTPEAAHQYNILCAELGKDDPKNTGPRLIAEALNWLFTRYGKPPIA
jgi:hypothetical protein